MGAKRAGAGISGDLVFDAGALIALERGDRRVAALLRGAGDLGLRILVPASALAQVWRGGQHSAWMGRLLDAWHVDSLDERRAKEVGLRLGQRGGADIADAHVVCCGLEHRAAIVTSDEGDIRDLMRPDEALVVVPV